MPIYAALPTLYPPDAMLSKVLEIAEQERDTFDRIQVTLLLNHGHSVHGTLLEMVSGADVDVVVIETRDGAAFVPISAIIASTLHPSEAQNHRLRTGETLVEDTYADHRHRCWSMGSTLSEDEVDFSVAEVELSVRLDDTGFPQDALASLLFDSFLDLIEQTLSQAIRKPGSRHALIFGCPSVSIHVQDTDQCFVSDGTLHIPVQVHDDRLVLLEEDDLETQVLALLYAQRGTVPAHWRSEGWGLVTSDADEQASWLEGILERTAPFSLDEDDLFAIDDDKAIEIRDMVRMVYASLRESHAGAVGTTIRQVILRRLPTRACVLEDGALVLPMITTARWDVDSLGYYEVDDELKRLLNG